MGAGHQHSHGHAHAHANAHAHGHGHGPASARTAERFRPRLRLAFALAAGFFAVQIVVGIVAGSLALISDAGHVATDAVGLGMALAAIRLATRGSADHRRTFGWYRLEILAALGNALLLFGVAGWVLYEAVRRLIDGAGHIDGPVVLVVGLLGLAVNLVAFALLRQGHEESLSLRGAYLEVLADLIGSVAVVVGAAAVWATDWSWIDPVLGAAIGLFVLPRAARLGRQAVRILVQAAPESLDPRRVHDSLAAIDGVVDVHDLHVWTLTSEMDVVTAHLMVREGADHHAVLDQGRAVLAGEHGVTHATLQVEPETHEGCHELTW